MINRIIRAIKLDKTLFSEVAHNESLLGESLIIVLLVAVVSGHRYHGKCQSTGLRIDNRSD